MFDDTRKGIHADTQEKVDNEQDELLTVGSELRYTQQTVASELAGWQDLHAKLCKKAIREYAERMVIREKDRLERMRRAIRGVVVDDVKRRGRSRTRT